MIFYLVEGALLFVLALAVFLLVTMHRELKRQNGFRQEFGRILLETSSALQSVDRMLREFDQRGDEAVAALGARISQAREVIAELDRLSPAAAERPARSPAARPAGERKSPLREDH